MGTHLVTLGGNSAGLDGLVHAVGKICTLIETESESESEVMTLSSPGQIIVALDHVLYSSSGT